ncbi:phosphoadenosine phosphosulfate reductase family protein, partial [Kribbella catacumbae]|uniref:phosphoadenosine phosphosulfate reductase domain-containing protein n=1 Tax=Kribbella catacumbae TaxID=460086 RepID=UPI00035EEE3F
LDDLGLPPETVVSQYDMDDVTARPYKGRVAIVNGIRATESLIRLRASMNKLNENYLNAGSSRKVTLAKPIFDWVENDVFRYFYDRGIRYCPLYDHQVLSGTELRVSTPLHAETSKRIGRLRTYAPTFYEQVMELFPEMLVQERYYRELDRAAMTAQYAGSIDGIRDWCTENIEDPPQLRKALKTLASITVAHKRNPQAYPLDYLLTQFMTGAFKRRILPISRADQARNARKAAKA